MAQEGRPLPEPPTCQTPVREPSEGLSPQVLFLPQGARHYPRRTAVQGTLRWPRSGLAKGPGLGEQPALPVPRWPDQWGGQPGEAWSLVAGRDEPGFSSLTSRGQLALARVGPAASGMSRALVRFGDFQGMTGAGFRSQHSLDIPPCCRLLRAPRLRHETTPCFDYPTRDCGC